MSSAEAIRCPSCGAPLPESAAHRVVTCSFCGAAASPAPKVVERVVDRVIVAKGEPGDPNALRCPRCAAVMLEKVVHEALVASCGTCGGVWLDTATVERLRAHRDPEIEEAARKMVRIVMPMDPSVRHAEIGCPRCAARMRRVEVPETIHCVDVCDAHGTWFDRDELKMFVSAFAEQRAGDVGEDDLRAAGVGGGFFTDLFRRLRGSSES